MFVDAHRDLAVRRRRPRAIVGTIGLDAASVIHGSGDLAEEAQALERKCAKVRTLLGEHRQHLALLAPVDARGRPALLPVREPCILLLDGVEPAALQGRSLRVLDRALDRPLAVGIGDSADVGDRTVVRRQRCVYPWCRGSSCRTCSGPAPIAFFSGQKWNQFWNQRPFLWNQSVDFRDGSKKRRDFPI